MRFNNTIERVNHALDLMIDGLAWVGAGALALMVLIVVSNVVGRYLFRKPVLGAVEMVGLLTVVVVFCVLAFTESKGAHIVVDIIISRLPGRIKAIMASIMCFIGAVFFIVVGWQGGDLMWSNLFPDMRTTGVLSIPFAPFMFIMAFGCLLFGLELLVHSFSILTSEEKNQED
jgi:TRAP-type C4-dicarboxylate transport system permease small subunit